MNKNNRIRNLCIPMLLSLVARAGVVFPPNQSLIHFTSKGNEVASKLIGTLNARDDFGGNEAYTPEHNIRVYVNFNIAGTIDLDGIDKAFSRLVREADRKWFQKKNLVVVSAATMAHWRAVATKNLPQAGYVEEDAFMNGARVYYFISASVLARPGGFQRIVDYFYASRPR